MEPSSPKVQFSSGILLPMRSARCALSPLVFTSNFNQGEHCQQLLQATTGQRCGCLRGDLDVGQ